MVLCGRDDKGAFVFKHLVLAIVRAHARRPARLNRRWTRGSCRGGSHLLRNLQKIEVRILFATLPSAITIIVRLCESRDKQARGAHPSRKDLHRDEC